MIQYPRAFIYDLDGVITDTAEFHYLAWKKLSEEIGITFDRLFNEQLKGINRRDSLEMILALDPLSAKLTMEEKEKLATRKNDYYLEFIEAIDASSILPGIEKLLQVNKQHQLKIALGSASKNATAIIGKLGLIHYFDYIVDASKVKNGKPDPETFTTAAKYLGVSYFECIGIEDSAAGIEAINKADMFSVGVGNPMHLSQADYIVENTSELVFEDLINHYQMKLANE